MNLRTISFTSDQLQSNILDDLHRLCHEAEQNISMPAHVNMMLDQWENKPNTLMYLLRKTDRFHSGNGLFTLLYDIDNNPRRIIACSGIYRSNFDHNVAIGGVRTWKIKDYRNRYLVSKYIFTDQINWCRSNGLKIFALTFNEYNLKVMKILNKSGLYLDSINEDMEMLDRKSYIQGVNQYVMFQRIDPYYNVNFPESV